MINKAKSILNHVFGYQDFRPLQQKIIENILMHKDTLVIMPTGGGKSLCYQIPALIFDALTVVVSPLISLMKDQVEQLSARNVQAAVLNSTLSHEAYGQNVSRILHNDVNLLYLAPETLMMPKTLAMLSSRGVDCIAIDEAHCISEWGHDFRPEYRQIAEVRNRFPNAVCVALTATATPKVQKDIQSCLNFEKTHTVIASFDRKNLFLQIIPKSDPVRQTMDFIEKFPNQSGIIYCLSRRKVDELTRMLSKSGFSAAPYHAGLSDDERRLNQERFISNHIQIMVATIAFGMGINKPNIRFVLHYDLPQNIESYYQQIGRAGRDGQRAHCLLLFGYGDIHKLKYFINQKSDKEKHSAVRHLKALIELAQTRMCRRIPLLSYFGESLEAPGCNMCDNCATDEPMLCDWTIPAQKFLSCVKRSGESCGAEHVIDILRGATTPNIFKFNHQDLSTYGIGKDYSRQQWLFLSRQLIAKEIIFLDPASGSLRLTPKSWEILKGKELFWGSPEKEADNFIQIKHEGSSCDAKLFELLKQKRKEIADNNRIHAFVVFPDKTLVEMAVSYPQSIESLARIRGVGSIKLEKYGQQFLDIICSYCQEKGIQDHSEPMAGHLKLSSSTGSTRKYLLIGEAFNSGKSLENLIEENNVKPLTILNHLHKFLADGHTLCREEEFLKRSALSSDQLADVTKAFDRLGTEQLKPVFDALNEKICYDELHLIRIYYLSRKQP